MGLSSHAISRLAAQSLDRAVRSVLRVKFLLCLFEHPFVDADLKDKVYRSQGNFAAVRPGIYDVAQERRPSAASFEGDQKHCSHRIQREWNSLRRL